jgi:hypothetical protein
MVLAENDDADATLMDVILGSDGVCGRRERLDVDEDEWSSLETDASATEDFWPRSAAA